MLSMNEAGSLPGEDGMIGPFDSLYEQPKPRFIFKMPRVVPDQKHKFETDELFRRLSRESEVSNSVNYCKCEYYYSILLIFLQLRIVGIFFVHNYRSHFFVLCMHLRNVINYLKFLKLTLITAYLRTVSLPLECN